MGEHGSRGVGSAVGSSIPARGAGSLEFQFGGNGPRLRRSEAPAQARRHARGVRAERGFWCAYEQQGNTTALFADQWVDLAGAPTEFVQSINPVPGWR